MTPAMDERFAAALRGVLVEQVQHSKRRRARHRVLRATGFLAGALTLVSGGIAFAVGALHLPGSEIATKLAPPVVVAGTGTQVVQLGPPPAAAHSIDIKLTCLSVGAFTTADGAQLRCDPADVGHGAGTMEWRLPVEPGQHTTTITAGPGERWQLVATYTAVTTSTWQVNPQGQTYGVANSAGTPDLVAVVATNGRSGYAYAAQLFARPTQPPSGKPNASTIPVYESDGQTVIGEFVVH